MTTIVVYEGPLEVAHIANAVRASRITFHAFEYRSRRLLYDLNSGVLLQLGEGAFTLFHGIERGIPESEIESTLATIMPLADERQALLRSALSLLDAGLFELEALDSEAERAASIAAYTEHHPNKMMLLIQTSCNLKCTYCYEVQSDFHQTGGAMKLSTATRAVDDLIAKSGKRRQLEITFFGGEPLLNFAGMKRIVQYARSAGHAAGKEFYFQMTTNGVLLSEEVIDYIVGESIGVMVSLDGNPEQNNVHRIDHKGRGVGETVVGNVQRLIARQAEAGQKLAKVRATLTKQNPDYGSVAQYFDSQGFKRVSIGGSMGRADRREPWDLDWEESPESRERAESRLDNFLDAISGGARIPPGADMTDAVQKIHASLTAPKRKAQIQCGVGRNMLAYAGNGKLYPCHRYAGEDAFEVGTVAEGLDRERLQRFYREVLEAYDDSCAHCWARNICGGQCPWYISRASGAVGTPDDASCNSLRRGFERQLWLYSELVHRGIVESVTKPERDHK